MKLTHIKNILLSTVKGFSTDNLMYHSAAIAFYTIFSLPAILILVISIAGFFFGDEAVSNEVVTQIDGLVGKDSAKDIQDIIKNSSQSASSTWAQIVGIGTLLFGATTVFISLQSALNAIWSVKAKPEKNILKFVVNRFLSLAMVVSIGFLLMVSLLLDAILALFMDYMLANFKDIMVYVAEIVNIVISIGVMTCMFGLIFKFLPDAEIKWKDVWIGALVTSLLFVVGKFLIGLYLGNSDLGSTYGAAGSVIILLVWVYYSTVILLFGAEFTQSYVQEYGKKIIPTEGAVKVREQEIPRNEVLT